MEREKNESTIIIINNLNLSLSSEAKAKTMKVWFIPLFSILRRSREQFLQYSFVFFFFFDVGLPHSEPSIFFSFVLTQWRRGREAPIKAHNAEIIIAHNKSKSEEL